VLPDGVTGKMYSRIPGEEARELFLKKFGDGTLYR
jgi:hypothetical protein